MRKLVDWKDEKKMWGWDVVELLGDSKGLGEHPFWLNSEFHLTVLLLCRNALPVPHLQLLTPFCLLDTTSLFLDQLRHQSQPW